MNNFNDYLQHHGIKGMKWGVRRYQNKDGSLTTEGHIRRKARDRIIRAEKTRGKVDEIVNSLSKPQKALLEAEDGYLSMEQGEYVVKRFLETDGNTPVAFFDILSGGKDPKTNKENVRIALAVNSKYQGQEKGRHISSKGTTWLKRNRSRFETVDWGAYTNNKGSRRLAEESGYIFDPDRSNDDWSMYYLEA